MKRTMFTTVIALCTASLAAPLEAGAATPPKLYATVGPGYTITLKNAAGTPVRSMRAGRSFTIVVRDRATDHNFRLSGPGFSRQTSISGTGTVSWNVTFRRGLWTYVCTPHTFSMKASFQAT